MHAYCFAYGCHSQPNLNLKINCINADESKATLNFMTWRDVGTMFKTNYECVAKWPSLIKEIKLSQLFLNEI